MLQVPAVVSDDPSHFGEQDVVVAGRQGPGAGARWRSASRRCWAPSTVVVPAMNGVPWWFSRHAPALGDAPLQSVDPGGRIGAAIDVQQVVGCVVHASTFVVEPGLVQHKMGRGLILGEPGGDDSPRVHALVELLRHAGFDATLSLQIRQDIWYKLWGNMTMNPVSAITGAPIDQVMADPLVLRFCSDAMREAAAIGAHIGCTIEQSPDDRHAITRRLGSFKTSMQQDVEAGRAIELDALVTVVREMAQRLGIATPNIDALLGLTRLFARMHGLYPAADPISH